MIEDLDILSGGITDLLRMRLPRSKQNDKYFETFLRLLFLISTAGVLARAQSRLPMTVSPTRYGAASPIAMCSDCMLSDYLYRTEMLANALTNNENSHGEPQCFRRGSGSSLNRTNWEGQLPSSITDSKGSINQVPYSILWSSTS